MKLRLCGPSSFMQEHTFYWTYIIDINKIMKVKPRTLTCWFNWTMKRNHANHFVHVFLSGISKFLTYRHAPLDVLLTESERNLHLTHTFRGKNSLS